MCHDPKNKDKNLSFNFYFKNVDFTLVFVIDYD